MNTDYKDITDFLTEEPVNENGHAPEKSADLIDFILFYVLLGTNGHKKEAILALLTADCNHGILNGYAPEYVKARHIAEYVCWTIYNSRNYYGIIACI